MNKLFILIGFIGIMTMFSCANRHLNSTRNANQKDLSELVQKMAGEFSSADQAKEDTLFYDINLVMFPIWETDENVKWLYVEQAVTRLIDKPYRQRVYRLSIHKDNIIESRVFELPDPEKFIHGWAQPELFNQINPDSLVVREGCAVFLKKEDDCYSGSTNDKDCKSTFRGAAYATSHVSVCDDQVVSWDQGWSEEDQQVWGAETRGYIFKRKDK